jgi:Histidine phosphatase superfamily (branch 1)
MTAQELARANGAPLEYDEGLQERNYGELRGRSYREIGADIFAEDFARRAARPGPTSTLASMRPGRVRWREPGIWTATSRSPRTASSAAR